MAGLFKLPKPWAIFLALVLASLIGVLDYITGYDFHVTAFYLIPVCWACRAAGRAAGLFMATACAFFFGVAEIMSGHVHEHPWYPYWNALMLLGFFVAAVYSLAAVLDARNSMREGEARFQALFAQSLLGVAQVETATGRWVRVNQRLCAMLGFEADELQKMTYQDVTYTDDVPKSVDAMRRLVAGEVKQLSIEKRYVRKDGNIVWGNLTMLPLWKEDQKPDFHLSVIEDSTARRQLEERLRQSQKLESVGYLAGGMAHEFNNILAAMMLNMNLVQMMSSLEPQARDLLREVDELSKRAASLIKQLLAFSRKSVMNLQPMDLAAAVSGQCNMLGRFLGGNIMLEFSSAEGMSWVKADKSMVEQILLNLCLNARDAMKNGGQIRLRLQEMEVNAEQVSGQENAHPGKYVCLSVGDTGCGMDERTLKRLFEPFFTTKDLGQGTGLGLATVRGMVQQHHGWVEVESCLGKGSTFRVYLPAAAPQVAAPTASEQETHVRGKGMILVAEDEPSVRRATRMLFARMGYVVLEATDGNEALEIWKTHREEIDLIFTDMLMPGGMTGLQLAEQVLAIKPGVKVIITSGYSTDLPDLSKAAESPIVYLPKPCDAATLTSVIQKCLQREQSPME
jgi:PAS domain S-box-containing protein